MIAPIVVALIIGFGGGLGSYLLATREMQTALSLQDKRLLKLEDARNLDGSAARVERRKNKNEVINLLNGIAKKQNRIITKQEVMTVKMEAVNKSVRGNTDEIKDLRKNIQRLERRRGK